MSRSHFHGNCLHICFQMEMRDNGPWDVVQEQVFWIRIGLLLSAFHFSVRNCGLKNRLWLLMEGRWLCRALIGPIVDISKKGKESTTRPFLKNILYKAVCSVIIHSVLCFSCHQILQSCLAECIIEISQIDHIVHPDILEFHLSVVYLSICRHHRHGIFYVSLKPTSALMRNRYSFDFTVHNVFVSPHVISSCR